MKRKTAALYDPYLDTLGGGEKHILSILKVLEDAGYDLTIFFRIPLSRQIEERFHLGLKRITFKPSLSKRNAWEKMHTLSEYHALFYVTDGSYFVSTAHRTFIFAMVPDRKLYHMSVKNRLKTTGNIFIANSKYTHAHLSEWGIKSKIVYPFIPDEFFAEADKKQPLILSVGRFFPHLHGKKHTAIIEAFDKLSQMKGFERHRLVLAGGLNEEDGEYFKTIKMRADKNPRITLAPNCSYAQLLSYYADASFYWHFAGFGEDEKIHPERVEHLGMTPLEAMAAGAITLCYRAGGPRELIREGKNGYLFSTVPELLGQMMKLKEDDKLCGNIKVHAARFVRDTFSYESFRQNVEKTILAKL